MEDKSPLDLPELVEFGSAKEETRGNWPLKERPDFKLWQPYCW